MLTDLLPVPLQMPLTSRVEMGDIPFSLLRPLYPPRCSVDRKHVVTLFVLSLELADGCIMKTETSSLLSGHSLKPGENFAGQEHAVEPTGPYVGSYTNDTLMLIQLFSPTGKNVALLV